MSNGLAIAAVTAVLKNVLEDGLVQNSALSSMGNVLLTTLPPDQVSVGVDGQPQLNLFLYQVSQNRNADWIGRDRNQSSQLRSKATHNENASLAINLHYLLTAYGSKDFQTEILLGSAMALMHQTPVLSNDKIREALKHTATINRAGLFAQAMESTSLPLLTEQLGQVQITPNLFDTEKMSRLWSLLQSSYRPSVAYEVSMIFIGDRKPSNGTNSKPEGLDRPYIEKVATSSPTDGAIIAGSSLIVYGRNLRGEITKLCLNGGKSLLEPEVVEENRLLFTPPQSLQAGTQQIQVIHQPLYKLQNSQTVESNERTFILHPIIATSYKEQESITQEQEGQVESKKKTLTVEFKPKVGQQQQVIFKLTSVNEADGEDYSFEAPPRNSDTSIIQLSIDAVTVGKYYIQVEVDGAESLTGMNQAGNVIHVL
jgi:Pvc16 N-terminal domain